MQNNHGGGFNDRLNRSVPFEETIYQMFVESPDIVGVIRNGTEHTHAEFMEHLRGDSSPAAKFVRYAPDGVFKTIAAETIHYDAKHAKSIEKDAYEAYMKYRAAGCRVVLIVRCDDATYWQDVEHLRLINGHETVKQFPTHRRYPVDNDGWITPRRKNGFNPNGQMSGTPYREIDFSSMNRLDPECLSFGTETVWDG